MLKVKGIDHFATHGVDGLVISTDMGIAAKCKRSI